MIQTATAISEGSWSTLTATGEATATRPSAFAVVGDGAHRPTTRASSDAWNMSGSSWPDRCATTTGTSTATDRATRGTFGRKAHRVNAATGRDASTRSAASTRPASDDGSVVTATI